MTKQEEIREGVAKRIYTDWNKSPEFTWEILPDYRKQSYRDWVDGVLFPYQHSQGVVIKVERELPYKCICGGYDFKPQVEKYSGGKVVHCYECDAYNEGFKAGFTSAIEPLMKEE